MKHRCFLLIPSLVLILLTFSTLCTSPALSTPVQQKTFESSSTPVSYYQIIIDNNIFRPLGYRPPVQRPVYELIGTMTGTHTRALILDKRSNRLVAIEVGERLGDATLIEVRPKQIMLQAKEKQTTLRLRHVFLR